LYKNIYRTALNLLPVHNDLMLTGVITGSYVHIKKGSRMKLKHKIGGAVMALALASGAIPSMISTAQAYENPHGGQHFDKGRFPRTIHIVLAVVAVGGLIALLASNGNDRPTSP
jgi:hypothetical protein